jgi:A/G-specific adenine glycosylase
MVQKANVKSGAPYDAAFLRRWPSVEALAGADLDEVLRMWAGLGYYSRARNLHRCAGEIVSFHGGRFPEDEETLAGLPGIGPYTAAAIAAIAFDRPATVVDGNVERVIARLFAHETPLPQARPELKRLAARLTPQERPGDYAQAMMDLGATVCTPRSPSCLLCPVTDHCAGRARGLADVLPYREAAKEKPVRRGTAFFALRSDGAVLLRRRPDEGLLGGMMEVPTGAWREGAGEADDPLADAPLAARWRKLTGAVRHTFTHFHLELNVYCAMVQRNAAVRKTADPERCRWVPRRDLDGEALPSLMRKVVAHALESGMGGKG